MHKLELVPAEPNRVLESLVGALSDGKAFFPITADADSIGTPIGAPAGMPTEVADETVLVVQTSGSTGRPKRVTLSAEAILASAKSSVTALGGPGQWLLALPVNYIAGINVLARSLVSETTPIVLGAQFEPREFLDAVDQFTEQSRFTSLVPNQLQRVILEATRGGEDDLDRLRLFDRILIGGQGMPSALRASAEDLGLRLTRTYGSSETCGGCVYDGLPLNGSKFRLNDGEIELGGDTLALGYLGDAELTEQRFYRGAEGRWYRTGDLGEIVDGKLRVIGRTDDLIISGGVKVSLREIEEIVRTEAGIPEAIVVGQSSERWGQVPVVFCTRKVLGLQELRELVGTKLGPAARPDRVVVLDAIPMLPNGKPDRVALSNR